MRLLLDERAVTYESLPTSGVARARHRRNDSKRISETYGHRNMAFCPQFWRIFANAAAAKPP